MKNKVFIIVMLMLLVAFSLLHAQQRNTQVQQQEVRKQEVLNQDVSKRDVPKVAGIVIPDGIYGNNVNEYILIIQGNEYTIAEGSIDTERDNGTFKITGDVFEFDGRYNIAPGKIEVYPLPDFTFELSEFAMEAANAVWSFIAPVD